MRHLAPPTRNVATPGGCAAKWPGGPVNPPHARTADRVCTVGRPMRRLGILRSALLRRGQRDGVSIHATQQARQYVRYIVGFFKIAKDRK